ncbi:hypothetical protein L208DRAFT_1400313 [Tricholoma matsutake]|nr:hypothetical protein L208DRAFT_1400313 [Tricholoma matsutake 945]
MSEPDDVLDLENPPQFNPEKWIGKGCTFPAKPEDVSRELSLYCDHLLEIPGFIVATVSNIPVQLFDHILGVQFRAIPEPISR